MDFQKQAETEEMVLGVIGAALFVVGSVGVFLWALSQYALASMCFHNVACL